MQPSSSMQPERPVSGEAEKGAAEKTLSRPACVDAAFDASRKSADAAASVAFNRSARALILDYLLRSCYKETALAFAATDTETPSLDASVLETLDQRAKVSGLLRNGDILPALALADTLLAAVEPRPLAPSICNASDGSSSIKLHKTCWTVRGSMPELYFQLGCQHFVELVRRERAEDALLFAQATLAPIAKGDVSKMSILQDVTVLLAFDEPSRSPGGALLSLDRREALAVTLNNYLYGACRKADSSGRSVLEMGGGGRLCTQSSLERVLRQIDVSGSLLKPPWALKDALM